MKLSNEKKKNEVFRRRRAKKLNAVLLLFLSAGAAPRSFRKRRARWKPWCLAPVSMHKIQMHVATIMEQLPSKHHLDYEDFLDELERCLSVPQGGLRPYEEQLWEHVRERARRLGQFSCIEY